jgi:4-hydroxy-tetrahydrodipicolinate reductase
MSDPVRVLLIGAAGRMGHAIKAAALANPGVEIAAEADQGDDFAASLANVDVVIDFSHADAAKQICAECVAKRKPIVIGTTGHSTEQVNLIREAARSIPVLLASNFSVGVNTLFWLARKAAELLGDRFDLEIVETHHRLKKDAPSGTAKHLAEILSEARGLNCETDIAHGRQGMIGERKAKEIGMHSIRAGDVVGDHTVVFASAGERLELTHRASSRETFALGALRAAKWILGKPAGLYSMEDVLGLSR